MDLLYLLLIYIVPYVLYRLQVRTAEYLFSLLDEYIIEGLFLKRLQVNSGTKGAYCTGAQSKLTDIP